MSELEICEVCEEATGKAGGVEDSLYLENWGGPFCDECYDSQVEELANSYGAVKAMALKYRATIAAKDAEIDRLLAVEACENVWGGDLRWDSDGKAFPDTDENPCVITRKALEQSEWERVLIERLVVLHILSPEHETNPSKALHDIISYEVLISLDPLVSSDAVALIEKYGGIYPPAEVET